MTEVSVANAARRIIELQSEIQEREEAIENYKHYIADNTTEPEQIVKDDDGHLFRVNTYVYRRFDANYGKSQRPDLFDKYATETKTLSAATAKKVMTDEEYAVFQRVSDGKSVKIEHIDD